MIRGGGKAYIWLYWRKNGEKIQCFTFGILFQIWHIVKDFKFSCIQVYKYIIYYNYDMKQPLLCNHHCHIIIFSALLHVVLHHRNHHASLPTLHLVQQVAIYLATYLSIYLSLHLSIYLSIYLYIYLYITYVYIYPYMIYVIFISSLFYLHIYLSVWILLRNTVYFRFFAV